VVVQDAGILPDERDADGPRADQRRHALIDHGRGQDHVRPVFAQAEIGDAFPVGEPGQHPRHPAQRLDGQRGAVESDRQPGQSRQGLDVAAGGDQTRRPSESFGRGQVQRPHVLLQQPFERRRALPVAFAEFLDQPDRSHRVRLGPADALRVGQRNLDASSA
jgi:hypothetical protein